MAFPKAKTKRFNEVTTCAPPPGHYDPEIKCHLPGASFQKTERFRPLVRETEEFMISNLSSSSTPFKRIYIAPLKYRRRSSSLNNLSIPMNMVSSHASIKWEEVISSSKYDAEMKTEGKNKFQNIVREQKPAKILSDKLGYLNLDSKIDTGKKCFSRGGKLPYVSKIDDLQDDIKHNENHLQVAYDSILSLNDEVKTLKDELYSWQEKEKVYLASEESILSEKKCIEKSLIELRHQYFEEKCDLNKEKEMYRKTLLYLKELLQNIDKDSSLVNEQFKESLSQLQLLDSKVEKLSQDKCMIELELKLKDAIYKEDCKEIKCSIFDYETIISSLITEMSAIGLWYVDTVTTHEDQKKALEKTILIQDEQLASLKVKMGDLEKEFNEINNTLLQNKDQEFEKDRIISQLKETNLDLTETFQKLKDKSVDTECKLENIIQKLEHAMTLNDKLKNENLSLLKSIEQFTTEDEKKCSLVQKLQKRINELQRIVDDHECEFTGIQQEIKILEENKYTLENMLSAQKEELCKLTNEYSKALLNLSIFKNSVKELNSSLQKLQTEKEQDVKYKLELQRENENYQCHREELNGILHENTQEITALKEKEKLICNEIASLRKNVESAKEEKKALEMIVDQLTNEKGNLLHQMNRNKIEAENRLQEEINKNYDFKRCTEFQLKLLENNTEEQKEMLLKYNIEMEKELSALNEKLQFQEKLYKEKISFLEELRNEIPVELKEKIECLKLEKDRWQKLFMNLESKIAPFKEHLDAYEIERNLLLSKTSETQLELQSLSEEYVRLLGHQNHKQKIRHVMKLKDENFNLKKEINQMKEKNLKQKKIMFHLEEELSHFKGRNQKNLSVVKNKENKMLHQNS